MLVFAFCSLLIDMGIPPDTKIHLIPKLATHKDFHYDNYTFKVNFSGTSCTLLDIISESEFFDVSSFILCSLTILGNDLLIVYEKGC